MYVYSRHHNLAQVVHVGLNVLFSIHQSVSHHNIMLLLPYVSQLSNVTSQLKDIYGLALCAQEFFTATLSSLLLDLHQLQQR
jgi:hypothetical protein